MTKIFHTTQAYRADHTRFGGKIYCSDFNTDHRERSNIHGSMVAHRIAQDFKFDQQCLKNIESSDLYKNGGERLWCQSNTLL